MRKPVPVSKAAVVSRINHRLAHEDQNLKACRDARSWNELGAYFIVDVIRNAVVSTHQDPKGLARELEVLQPWEKMEN